MRFEQLLASPSENVRKRLSESDCALRSHTSPPSTLHADIMQEPCSILLTRSSDLEPYGSLQSFHGHPIALLPWIHFPEACGRIRHTRINVFNTESDKVCRRISPFVKAESLRKRGLSWRYLCTRNPCSKAQERAAAETSEAPPPVAICGSKNSLNYV